MSQSSRPVNQAVKYSPTKDIFFLAIFLSALIVTFLNLPGMLGVAYYAKNIRPLAVRQCWTFSFCATLGLIVIFRFFSGSLISALKTHLLLSFAAALYLAVSCFGLNQQYPKQYLELYLPASVVQKLDGMANKSALPPQ
jgi:hypothetical protein